MLLRAVAACSSILVWCAVQGQFNTYNKSYGGPSVDGGRGLAPAPDGGCVVVGFTSSYGPNAGEQTPNGHVLRVDGAGEVLWRRSYGGQNNDILRKVVGLPNGDHLAVGAFNWFGPGGASDIWLSRIQDDGSVVWNKRYGTSSHREYGNTIMALENGDCLVAGVRSQSSGGNEGNMLLMKVNMEGEVIWTAEIGSTRQDEPGAIVRTNDGGFMIAGTRTLVPQPQDGSIIRVGPDGAMLWNRTYATSSAGVAISSLVASGSDQYVASLSRGLMGLDGDGNVLWSRGYSAPDGGSFSIQDVKHAGNGRFLLLMSLISEDYTQQSMAALVVDDTGLPIAAMDYGQLANGFARAALHHPDGGFILLGQLDVQGGDINLVRTWAAQEGLGAGCHAEAMVFEPVSFQEITYGEPYTQLPAPVFTTTNMGLPPASDGNGTTYCSNVGLPPSPEMGSLALFPVPASDFLHLDRSFPDGPVQMAVIDAIGRRVLEHSNFYGRTLDVRALPVGVYYCLVEQGDGSLVISRFLVAR